MNLKKYIFEHQKTTISKAAIELEITRQHLHNLCNGGSAGKKLAARIQDWSGGLVTVLEVLYPGKDKDLT